MCKHPLKGFSIGITENGKPNYKIVPYSVNHIEYQNKKWNRAYTSFVSPYSEKCVTAFVEIPCGKCVECRLNYSRQWADRCLYELKYYRPEECWFVTVTYDDDNIMDIGSNIFSGTLLKNDLVLFIKNLRRQCDYHEYSKSIRYYACGEYGSKTNRPHYHIILYGLDLLRYDKLSKWQKSKSGFWTWRSPLLEKIWKKGLIVVSPVSWDTCAYTARYVMKKVKGFTQDDYVANGVEPEFVIMSRKPGIGFKYFDDHYKEIYENDEIFISSPDGGRKTKPPRAFDTKYEKINPSHYQEIKKRRREIAETVTKMKLERTGLSYTELLEVEETILNNKVSRLIRSI